ncbi:phage tail assembly chaperone [Pelotomaculum propionicicum]|uniref:phage tail assembly chaperone n=1 Tax=Pelotomaculum propionicicum TaxID=258475 RepID=UPI003B824D75
MSFEKMTEDQILQRLLETDTVPERTVVVPRLNIPVTLRGLTGKQVFSIRERCSERNERRGRVTERLDEEQFNVALIATATVKPDWGNQKLINKFNASGPEEVIKRILLAGELSALSNIVLDLSGFNISLEDVKN